MATVPKPTRAQLREERRVARINAFLSQQGLSELFETQTQYPVYFVGSSLLALLYDEPMAWKPKDIDIQCRSEDFDTVTETVERLLEAKHRWVGVESTTGLHTYLDLARQDGHPNPESVVRELGNILRRTLFVAAESEFKRLSIDAVNVDVVGLDSEVLDNVRLFDLSCCRNAYNPTRGLVMFEPEDVEEKSFRMAIHVSQRRLYRSRERADKYVRRGFRRKDDDGYAD